MRCLDLSGNRQTWEGTLGTSPVSRAQEGHTLGEGELLPALFQLQQRTEKEGIYWTGSIQCPGATRGGGGGLGMTGEDGTLASLLLSRSGS